MQEISTMQASGSDNFKGPQVTIGLDLGDRPSNYCVLNAPGDILLEDKLPTTSLAMKQLFGRMLRSRIAMETSTHSRVARRPCGCLSTCYRLIPGPCREPSF